MSRDDARSTAPAAADAPVPPAVQRKIRGLQFRRRIYQALVQIPMVGWLVLGLYFDLTGVFNGSTTGLPGAMTANLAGVPGGWLTLCFLLGLVMAAVGGFLQMTRQRSRRILGYRLCAYVNLAGVLLGGTILYTAVAFASGAGGVSMMVFGLGIGCLALASIAADLVLLQANQKLAPFMDLPESDPPVTASQPDHGTSPRHPAPIGSPQRLSRALTGVTMALTAVGGFATATVALAILGSTVWSSPTGAGSLAFYNWQSSTQGHQVLVIALTLVPVGVTALQLTRLRWARTLGVLFAIAFNGLVATACLLFGLFFALFAGPEILKIAVLFVAAGGLAVIVSAVQLNVINAEYRVAHPSAAQPSPDAGLPPEPRSPW